MSTDLRAFFRHGRPPSRSRVERGRLTTWFRFRAKPTNKPDVAHALPSHQVRLIGSFSSQPHPYFVLRQGRLRLPFRKRAQHPQAQPVMSQRVPLPPPNEKILDKGAGQTRPGSSSSTMVSLSDALPVAAELKDEATSGANNHTKEGQEEKLREHWSVRMKPGRSGVNIKPEKPS